MHTLQEGRVAYLSLYDREKAFDSVEHSILLQSLYQASINGKAWRLIKACYGNLTPVVKSGSSLSHPFPVTRGVQQGSVVSPTFFLIVMDKLLNQLRECSAGTSVHDPYLRGELPHLHGHAVETIPQAVYMCLGYSWSDNLSARRRVQSNISKARRQFFDLSSSGCFLDFSSPLSAREVVETCVIPTLLYGTENWILDEACLEL